MALQTSRLLMLNLGQASAALNDKGHRSQRRTSMYRMAFVRSRSVPAGYELTSVWDITQTGIGLLFRRELDPGEKLDVRFGQELARDRVATVVHTLLQKDGWWLIGCTLDRPLSLNELAALLE